MHVSTVGHNRDHVELAIAGVGDLDWRSLNIPAAEVPGIALAILTAAGLIKPAGLVAEDETQGHRRQTIDGEYYSANSDPEFWVDSVDRTMTAFINEAQYLVRSTAVRDYFADETAREAEATRRRDEMAAKLFDLPVHELHPGPFTYVDSTEVVRNAIDMIIKLQDEAKK